MTEAEVLEAIQNYANQNGFEIKPPKDNIIEMKFHPNPKVELALKYDLTGGGGAWITFKLLLGQILDLGACIGLLFIGRIPGTSFYLRGEKIGDSYYLFGETFVHLRKDMTVHQATDEMCLVADMKSLFLLPPITWPRGVEIYFLNRT